MSWGMPILETERLIIRPFQPEDRQWIASVLSRDDAEANQRYIEGSVTAGDYLASLGQPPYGDRAAVHKADQRLIGAVGLVPLLMPFDHLPYFSQGRTPQVPCRFTAEMGLYWEFDPAYRQQGYATEAARALIDYAFTYLNLRRILANTDYDNTASQGVMRKLGMSLEHNPLPEPHWFQVVGILENTTGETRP